MCVEIFQSTWSFTTDGFLSCFCYRSPASTTSGTIPGTMHPSPAFMNVPPRPNLSCYEQKQDGVCPEFSALKASGEGVWGPEAGESFQFISNSCQFQFFCNSRQFIFSQLPPFLVFLNSCQFQFYPSSRLFQLFSSPANFSFSQTPASFNFSQLPQISVFLNSRQFKFFSQPQFSLTVKIKSRPLSIGNRNLIISTYIQIECG